MYVQLPAWIISCLSTLALTLTVRLTILGYSVTYQNRLVRLPVTRPLPWPGITLFLTPDALMTGDCGW